MTNREAFNIYLQMRVQQAAVSVEHLSDIAMLLWQQENHNVYVGVRFGNELSWFWNTYGGREVGRGINNMVRWLSLDFNRDIQTEIALWRIDENAWANKIEKEIEQKYNLNKEG